VSPCSRISQPIPPPKVRPAMPVWLTMPPVVASPDAWLAWSISPHRTPACAVARRPAASTSTLRMVDRSMTIPPSHTAVPATL